MQRGQEVLHFSTVEQLMEAAGLGEVMTPTDVRSYWEVLRFKSPKKAYRIIRSSLRYAERELANEPFSRGELVIDVNAVLFE